MQPAETAGDLVQVTQKDDALSARRRSGSGTVNVYYGGMSSSDLLLSQSVDSTDAATSFNELTITNETPTGRYVYVDNLSLVSGAVPEPSSMALLLISTGILAVFGLKRFPRLS